LKTKLGFSLHSTRKTLEGKQHPDRDFGVLNTNGLDPPARATRAKFALCVNLGRVLKAIWVLEERVRPVKPTRMFAQYVVVIARR